MVFTAGESLSNIKDGIEKIRKNIQVMIKVILIFDRFDGSSPPLTRG